LIFLFDQILGIWLAGFFFILYLISYLISLSSKIKLLRLIQEHLIISDKEIADKLERPIDNIRKILSSLSKNQKNKKWLIVFLNKRYISLNENGVENFKQLYKRGYNEKKILEDLQQEMRIRSRAEVKAIEITLAKHKRLDN
jgi:predicted solute-binding protein